MNTVHSKNPRAKKLNNIMTKIAMFMLQETFTDESPAHRLLERAMDNLEKAAEILISNDEKESVKK